MEEKFSDLAKITSNVKFSGSEDIEIKFFNNFDFNGLVLVIKNYFKENGFKFKNYEGSSDILAEKGKDYKFGCFWIYNPSLSSKIVLISTIRLY